VKQLSNTSRRAEPAEKRSSVSFAGEGHSIRAMGGGTSSLASPLGPEFRIYQSLVKEMERELARAGSRELSKDQMHAMVRKLREQHSEAVQRAFQPQHVREERHVVRVSFTNAGGPGVDTRTNVDAIVAAADKEAAEAAEAMAAAAAAADGAGGNSDDTDDELEVPKPSASGRLVSRRGTTDILRMGDELRLSLSALEVRTAGAAEGDGGSRRSTMNDSLAKRDPLAYRESVDQSFHSTPVNSPRRRALVGAQTAPMPSRKLGPRRGSGGGGGGGGGDQLGEDAGGDDLAQAIAMLRAVSADLELEKTACRGAQ